MTKAPVSYTAACPACGLDAPWLTVEHVQNSGADAECCCPCTTIFPATQLPASLPPVPLPTAMPGLVNRLVNRILP
jgi:hypothetical protein